MKSFKSILTLRLTKEEKEPIDLIVKEEKRISSGTSAGALRQMIMLWRPLSEELRKAKAECLALSQLNMKYEKAIGDHCRSLDQMKKMAEMRKGEDLDRDAAEPKTAAQRDVAIWRQNLEEQGRDYGIGD